MPQIRKLILTIFAFCLLCSFSVAALSNSFNDDAEILSFFQDTEEDDSEGKEVKFLSHTASEINLVKLVFDFEHQPPTKLQKNFSQPLTTPPDC